MDIDLEQLRELMAALVEHDFQELEIRKGSERILLRRGPATGAAAAAPVSQAPPPPSPAAAPPPTVAPAPDAKGTLLTSPLVGTFYRSPSPDSEPFVKVGDRVRAGQVLCIVEAMKLMNEIEAESDGVVLEILVENGKPVEFGTPLFKIENDR